MVSCEGNSWNIATAQGAEREGRPSEQLEMVTDGCFMAFVKLEPTLVFAFRVAATY